MSSPIDAGEAQAGPRSVPESEPVLNLYLVRPKARLCVLIAARDEAHARSFPPFSNWKTLLKFGSWHPKENARARVQYIGVAGSGVEEGPLLFGE